MAFGFLRAGSASFFPSGPNHQATQRTQRNVLSAIPLILILPRSVGIRNSPFRSNRPD